MKISPKYTNVSCKICDGNTSVLGVCDFNKSCEGDKVKNKLPPIGYAVYYHQCNNCKFIFTVDFDDWSVDDYLENIYNDEYTIVDPEYTEVRPKNLVNWFLPLLGGNKDISVLDYGAGSAVFGKELSKLGWKCESWDPMWKQDPTFDKGTTFDVVTAFEVLEHTPSPYETAKEIINFVDQESGQLVIQTLSNDIIGTEGLNYWYIAPRNGHVCMHSNRSLDIMFDKLGMTVDHLAPNTHVASWKDE